MPIISFDVLEQITSQLLEKMGFNNQDASIIGHHLAEANLLGHHSHGIIRLSEYYWQIQKGEIKPRAKIVQQDFSANIAMVNGNGAIGHVVSKFAAELAIEKACSHGVAVVTINTMEHAGRLGAFVQQISDANMIAFYCCNGHSNIKLQAPFGGKEKMLPANVMAFAAPREKRPALVVDMSSTAIAFGKLMEAKNRDETLPPDCLIDKDGNPTINPLDFFSGGSLLPLGGVQGHKGFAIALMIEVLAGILSRAKMNSKNLLQDNNGGFMLALNINNFLPLEHYFSDIEKMCDHLKSCALRPGFTQIFIPGEHSAAIAKRQLQTGIEIAGKTWQKAAEIAKELQVTLP